MRLWRHPDRFASRQYRSLTVIMSSLWKVGGTCLLMMVLVWLVSIWRWQTTEVDVSGRDLVLQLVALPLMLTAVLFAVLWMAQRIRVPDRCPVDRVDAPQPAPASVVTDELERSCSVAVAEVAVMLSVGRDAGQAMSAVLAGMPRPSLAPLLQDMDGLPVFSARVEELDLASAEHALPPHSSDQMRRAAALLLPPLQQLLDRLGECLELTMPDRVSRVAQAVSSYQPDMKAHLAGIGAQRPAESGATRRQPGVVVRLAVPVNWPQAVRDHLLAWLRGQCHDKLGAFDLRLEVHLHPMEAGAELWQLLDQQMKQWARQAASAHEACVLLVADSAIDPEEVDRWQARGELFTASHQSGRIPGEAAAGLLMLSAHWSGLTGELLPLARMYRPVCLSRDKSADAIGRVGHATLLASLSQALQLAGGAPVQVEMVVSDGDHRASRTAEVFEALLALNPELDPMLAIARVGDLCGDLGLAGALVPTALAASALARLSPDRIVLASQVQPSHHRAAIALRAWLHEPEVATPQV